MKSLRCYRGLIAFIILSFLGMQASSAHIHLPAHHDHDGSHHQHQARGHAHDLASHHRDTIDVAPGGDEHNIVELCDACTTSGWGKQDETADVFIATVMYFDLSTPLTQAVLASTDKQVYSPPNHSNYRPRAPPLSVRLS